MKLLKVVLIEKEWYYIMNNQVIWQPLDLEYSHKKTFYEKYFKRLIDILCSIIAILVFWWLYIIVAIMVRIKLGSPIIFKQQRPGLNEEIFCLYKFRTMTDERDSDGKMLPDEVRLTKFGKWLRSTSLDELPEIFNILKGDMSVIGPRPQLVRDMVFMTKAQRTRHLVRPGLSGLAQVNGRNAISWESKLDYDKLYIKKITFLKDMKIVFQTVIKAFVKHEGIIEENMATAEDFGDYLLRTGKVNKEKYDQLQSIAIEMIEEKHGIMGWRYYNKAMIPDTAPHEEVNIIPIKNGNIWSRESDKPLLARWTTDFDCGYETEWWYVIKDTSFDIADLKAKRRYEINKGNRNFDVWVINPSEYDKDIYIVHKSALTAYPQKYRPQVSENDFIQEISNNWNGKLIYGAFDKETGALSGYALLTEYSSYIDFNVLKTMPNAEKKAINAAIVYKIISDFNERLGCNFYICDGSRNVLHETAFQDYLEKYFGFRKAYGKLNIKYRLSVGLAVKILYPFRKVIAVCDRNALIHNISGLLTMESIRRKCKSTYNQ